MFQPCDNQVTVHGRTDMACRDKEVVTSSVCGRDKAVTVPVQAESADNQVNLFRQGETPTFQLDERAFFDQAFHGSAESFAFAGAQVQGLLDLSETQGAAGMLLQQVKNFAEDKTTHVTG